MAPGTVGMTMFVSHSYAMFSAPVFIERPELSSPVCTFPELSEWTGKLQKLHILKITVRVLLQSDIDILAGLPVLASLIVYPSTHAESVVFNSGAFPVLKYFKYRCDALWLVFKDKALLNLRRLKLDFDVHRGGRYIKMISVIEYLFSLEKIAVKIGAAAGAKESDRSAAESALKDAIQKHPRFPYFFHIKGGKDTNSTVLAIPAPVAAPPPDGQEWDTAVEVIKRWKDRDRLVFDSREDGEEYLAAAANVVGRWGLRMEGPLQAAMERLRIEFRHLLIRGARPLASEDRQISTLLWHSPTVPYSSSSSYADGWQDVLLGSRHDLAGHHQHPQGYR